MSVVKDDWTSAHADNETAICEFCGVLFSYRQALEKHKQICPSTTNPGKWILSHSACLPTTLFAYFIWNIFGICCQIEIILLLLLLSLLMYSCFKWFPSTLINNSIGNTFGVIFAVVQLQLIGGMISFLFLLIDWSRRWK